MSEAFGTVLDHVLGPHGLVVYDAADPAAKPFARGLFTRALADPGGPRRWRRPPARPRGPRLPRPGHRRATRPRRCSSSTAPASRSAFAARRRIVGDRELPLAEVAALAEASPERFSPNVLLRPLVQDTIFPTVCYVGGPSELAYLGQLREVYAALRRPDAAGGAAGVGLGRRLGRPPLPRQARHPASTSSSARTS